MLAIIYHKNIHTMPVFNHLFFYLPSFCLCGLLLVNTVKASELIQPCDKVNENCVQTGSFNFAISIGAGIRTNPLFDSSDIPLVLLPEISYYGDRFFIENLDFGYTLLDRSNSSLGLIATPSYDSVFFNRWDPGNLFVDLSSGTGADSVPIEEGNVEDNSPPINPDELDQRKFSYLAGIEYHHWFKNSLLQLSVLSDITNTHSGKEIRFAYAYNVSQNLATTFGFTWKDKNLSDYYYGVKRDESVDYPGAYKANHSLTPFVRISFNRQTFDRDSWRFSIEYQRLDSQISNSPIVNDDYILTIYAGKTFRFE